MACGTRLLRFRCTACGACCRAVRVPVTDADLRRLIAGTGKRADELVDWLEPAAIDMSGEPSSFAELDVGRRVMLLASRSGGCTLLGADDKCSAYAERPLNCRIFPFDATFGRRGGLRRLRLLRGDHPCPYELDGQADSRALQRLDAQRWAEHSAYQKRVLAWNLRQKQLTKLGRRPGSRDAFLAFLGVSAARADG